MNEKMKQSVKDFAELTEHYLAKKKKFEKSLMSNLEFMQKRFLNLFQLCKTLCGHNILRIFLMESNAFFESMNLVLKGKIGFGIGVKKQRFQNKKKVI